MQLDAMLSWYARKPYIHFDLPLGAQAAANYVSNPKNVKAHAFYPLLRYEIRTPRIKKLPNSSGRPFTKEPKVRPIAYPAHKDGYIFSFYRSLLEDPYEKWLGNNGLDEAVTAFRSIGQNNVSLAKKAFDFIGMNPDCQIVVTDVESFFDNVDHQLLKKLWARFSGSSPLTKDQYAVYRAITRYSYVERHKAYNLFRVRLSGRSRRADSSRRLCTPTQFRDRVVTRGLIRRGAKNGVGIPQGTSLSPLLSNMYMADLDLAMHQWISSLGGKYWRYCDDILVVVPDGNSQSILSRLDLELKALKLNRSHEKTALMSANELASQRQLQYLGLVFNGTDAVIRSSSIHRYRRKIDKSIRLTKNRQYWEGRSSPISAPFRKQALFNMFSEKSLRGKRVNARVRRRKFRGNFTHYMSRAAGRMQSSSLSRQRLRELRKLKDRLRQYQ